MCEIPNLTFNIFNLSNLDTMFAVMLLSIIIYTNVIYGKKILSHIRLYYFFYLDCYFIFFFSLKKERWSLIAIFFYGVCVRRCIFQSGTILRAPVSMTHSIITVR